MVGDVPVATFGDPPGRGGGGRALLARSGGPNFTALNNSLRAVVTEATANALRIK